MRTLSRFDSWSIEALDDADVPAMQRFFDANPEYFVTVNGAGPSADEARNEFDDLPPAGMRYRERWVIGFVDGAGALVGVGGVLGDFLVDSVWHVGLFIIASELHGSGAAERAYRALEEWMRARGARGLRLGVVKGSVKAERFWAKVGFVEVRERGPVAMGRKSNLLRVMVKPLAAAAPADYLALVERDRPGSA
jgi:GNAT superfamily N-acetyltransferase